MEEEKKEELPLEEILWRMSCFYKAGLWDPLFDREEIIQILLENWETFKKQL